MVRLTDEEKQWLEGARRRIALDATNWLERPYVTHEELYTMSKHVAERIMSYGWEPDQWAMIERNPKHPDNADFMRQLEHVRWHNEKWGHHGGKAHTH